MRLMLIFLTLILLLSGSLPGRASADIDIGISIGDEGIKGFHLAVGAHYGVPEKEVIIIRKRGVPDDEIPVVLFIAARVRVAPATIIDLRLHGKTWMDITHHFRLSPEIFYVPVKTEVKGPPYGRALGYYRNRPRREWKKIMLKDDDVINLVNLKFISEYHGYSPDEVIKLRSNGKDFIAINDEVKRGKKEKIEKQEGHKKEKKEKQEKQKKQKQQKEKGEE